MSRFIFLMPGGGRLAVSGFSELDAIRFFCRTHPGQPVVIYSEAAYAAARRRRPEVRYE